MNKALIRSAVPNQGLVRKKEKQMNKLITKARSGVTLVELLVVILIVTILSVSMLPLLQPFVVEAQYAAEPIPVIGNLRTKIGVYQYDKGALPGIGTNKIETWIQGILTPGTSTSPATFSKNNGPDVDGYGMAWQEMPAAASTAFDPAYCSAGSDEAKRHFGTLCDIDYQELKGKRSKPCHYQYLVMLNGTDYAYFVGCFGDGNGLKTGTGYAVCEIVSPKTGHKYVGTWKRYKPVGTSDAQIFFTSDDNSVDADPKHTAGCYVPEHSQFTGTGMTDNGNGELRIIGLMKTCGWEF